MGFDGSFHPKDGVEFRLSISRRGPELGQGRLWNRATPKASRQIEGDISPCRSSQ